MDDKPDSHRRHSGPDCRTMADVRCEIDRLDRELVRLLAERQSYIEAAARIKLHRDQVRDPNRIADVLSKVRAAAEATGLNQTVAAAVWGELIERSIDHEFRTFDRLHR